MAPKYFNHIWDVRDDYIRLILEPTDEIKYLFFKQHASKILSSDEVVQALKLLEMQKFAMLMFTSCGWFFTEISGIETVQIIQYAARAVQIAEELTGKALEEEFLKHLAKAKSNVPAFQNGRGVYERLIKPVVVSFHQ